MKFKTAELPRRLLNWAVGMCEGFDYTKAGDPRAVAEWSPSTDWAQGGPIIEREWLNLNTEDEDDGDNDWQWVADPHQSQDLTCRRYGRTPLIAAMRCYVASKLGDEVDIPDELF